MHQTNGVHHYCYAALDFSRDGNLPVARIAALRYFTAWLGRADEALYRAKPGGRNQVAIASPGSAQ